MYNNISLAKKCIPAAEKTVNVGNIPDTIDIWHEYIKRQNNIGKEINFVIGRKLYKIVTESECIDR